MNAMSGFISRLAEDKVSRYAGVSGGGERGLAAAVILQAWTDCASPNQHMKLQDFDAAWKFLTATSGRDLRAREMWCGMADMCPDSVREHTLRTIDYDAGLAKLREALELQRARVRASQRKHYVPMPHTGRWGGGVEKLAALTDEHLMSMRAAGKSIRVIAKELGLGTTAIKVRLRGIKGAQA